MHGSLPHASCSAGAGGGGDVRSAGFDDEKWVGFRGVGCWIGAINFPPGLLGPGLCMHGWGGIDGAGSVYLYASAACKGETCSQVRGSRAYIVAPRTGYPCDARCLCVRTEESRARFRRLGPIREARLGWRGERSMSAVAATVDATGDGCCVRCLRSGKPSKSTSRIPHHWSG